MQDRAAAEDDVLIRAHERVVRDGAFQFDREGFTPPEVPAWLGWIGDAIGALEPLLKVLFWIGLALLVALLLYAIGREILRLRAPRAKADKPVAETQSEWRPDAQAARDLLTEADALAAQGRYAEAAHLLLLRSVQDIERRQPKAVRVSLTTREIASLQALPDTARPAFTRIGRVVERSLFGGASVQADDFADCRRAYEAFALPEGWRA